MFKRFLCVFLVIQIFLLLPVNVFASDFKSLIRIYDQDASAMSLQNFLSEFDDSEYAGAYIDDYGRLVINLLDEDSETIDFIRKENETLLRNKSNTKIIYKHAQYSMSYLKSVVKQISNNLSEKGIFGVSIDEEKNKIVLDVYESSELKESSSIEWKDALKLSGFCEKDDLFIINKTDMQLQTTASMRPGAKYKIGNSSFTVAWGAIIEHSGTNNGKEVFLIPGHCSAVNNNLYFGSTYVGKVIERDFGGCYDFGYVENTNHSMTSVFANGESLPYGSPYRNPPQGLAITSFGAVSGKQTGKILQTNYSTIYSGISLSGVYKSSYKALNGDSGAPVYSNAPIGMQSLSLLSNGSWVSSSYSVFVPMYNLCERNSVHDIFLTTF